MRRQPVSGEGKQDTEEGLQRGSRGGVSPLAHLATGYRDSNRTIDAPLGYYGEQN